MTRTQETLSKLNMRTAQRLVDLRNEYENRPARRDETRAAIWGYIHALEDNDIISEKESAILEGYALGIND